MFSDGPVPPHLILHMSHVSNLATIAARGALLCESRRTQEGIPAVNIAYPELKERRSRTMVRACRAGSLNEYVPFYFAPRSPMLFAIKCGNIAGYPDGQTGVAYLISSVEEVAAAGLPFAFTDGHPVSALSDHYDDLAELGSIDWELMQATYWNDTADDNDRRRRRQAEFLVHDAVPLNLLNEVVVRTDEKAAEVEAALKRSAWKPRVRVLPGFYF